MVSFRTTTDAGRLDGLALTPNYSTAMHLSRPSRESCDQGLHQRSRRRSRRWFSWILATRADRDLVFQDRRTRG
jgi:hypothetical protein